MRPRLCNLVCRVVLTAGCCAPAACETAAVSGGANNAGTSAGPPAANSGAGGSAARATVAFTTRTLSSDHYAEGAAAGDLNGDGNLDLIAGPRWYAGPDFALSGTIVADPPKLGVDQYGAFFLTFTRDVNGDGRLDVIGVGDAGGGNGSGTPNTFWYENPGAAGFAAAWPKHPLFSGPVSNESPLVHDLVGDGDSELVFMTDDSLGYASPAATANDPWRFTAISGDTRFGAPYVHGLGVGDVDGDGLFDIVERSGWWRQTANTPWERHAFAFWLGNSTGRAANWGGAQMAIYDGDGDSDVVSALAAHHYGLGWFERRPNATPEFVAHEILPTTASADNVSQLHALVSADVNSDGLLDVVTGKRFYAHPSNSPDPGTTDPAKLLWFELQRGSDGARFVPHVVHEDSGVGCNFVARDVTGDGKVDIFTTSKRGTFLHVQL